MEAEQRNAALFLVSIQTGQKRRLTTPPNDAAGDTTPAFSPNGHTLIFSRDYFDHSDLCLLGLNEDYEPQGIPKKVETGNVNDIGAAWTADGREIVFSSGEALWRMEATGPGKPVRLA